MFEFVGDALLSATGALHNAVTAPRGLRSPFVRRGLLARQPRRRGLLVCVARALAAGRLWTLCVRVREAALLALEKLVFEGARHNLLSPLFVYRVVAALLEQAMVCMCACRLCGGMWV